MVGQRIRERRKALHMTQEQLAVRVYSTKANISSYETARTEPPKEMLGMLAKALNTSADYLIGMTEDPTPVKGEKEMDLTVIENLAKQSPSIRRYINNYRTGTIGYVTLLERSLTDLAATREKQSV